WLSLLLAGEPAVELFLLLGSEELLHLGLTVAQQTAVVLPEIVERGFHLDGLLGSEIEVFLQLFEIQGSGRGTIDGGRALPVVNAEVHDQRDNGGAGEEYQDQCQGADNARIADA